MTVLDALRESCGLYGKARSSLPTALRVACVRKMFASDPASLQVLEFLSDADSAFRHLTPSAIGGAVSALQSYVQIRDPSVSSNVDGNACATVLAHL